MSKNRKQKQPAAKAVASEYITISVAEYVHLVKAATLLEVIANDTTFDNRALAAVKATVQDVLFPDEIIATGVAVEL